LAASVAMIQMNLLMETNGKTPSSFAVFDLMRLPLGILTGVGFIGAGAIVRKSDLVMGLTTAATLWFATVVGLCLGGGQLILGSVATAIGFGSLVGLRTFERNVEHYRMAELRLRIASGSLTAEQLRQRLLSQRFSIKSFSVTGFVHEGQTRFELEVRWPSDRGGAETPALLGELERLPGLVEIEWKAIGTAPS